VDKPQLYARLGVKEYFLFDPHQEYLDPPLQGHRLSGNTYVQIEPDPAGCLLSEELELRLCVAESLLQFYRLETGERLLTRAERAEREGERAAQEAERAAQEAERAAREAERAAREAERADRESQARQAAEAELARLRDELARRSPPNSD
jgi:hypothetical protein